MTTVSPEPTDQPVPTQALDGAVEEYPRDKLYVKTAITLALITAVEVSTYYWPGFFVWSWGDKAGIISILILLMAVKFFTVAYVFMHLKFDKPLLTWVFYAGLSLAVLVYLAIMTMFRIWWPQSHMVNHPISAPN